MALLWKMICNLGDPMSLRHPVRGKSPQNIHKPTLSLSLYLSLSHTHTHMHTHTPLRDKWKTPTEHSRTNCPLRWGVAIFPVIFNVLI